MRYLITSLLTLAILGITLGVFVGQVNAQMPCIDDGCAVCVTTREICCCDPESAACGTCGGNPGQSILIRYRFVYDTDGDGVWDTDKSIDNIIKGAGNCPGGFQTNTVPWANLWHSNETIDPLNPTSQRMQITYANNCRINDNTAVSDVSVQRLPNYRYYRVGAQVPPGFEIKSVDYGRLGESVNFCERNFTPTTRSDQWVLRCDLATMSATGGNWIVFFVGPATPPPTATPTPIPPPTLTPTPVPPSYRVTVNVYESDVCAGAMTPDPPFTTTVAIPGYGTRDIGPSSYTTQYDNVSSSVGHTVSLNIPSDWQLSTGGACSGNDNPRSITVSADTVVNFYVMQTPNASPWWQTTGGDVGANDTSGTVVTSLLPNGEVLSLSNSLMHAGMLIPAINYLNLGSSGGMWSDRGDGLWTVESLMYTGGAYREDFGTFVDFLNLPATSGWPAGSLMTKGETVMNTTHIPGVYAARGTNLVLGDWVPGTGFDIDKDESMIVFVEGNLRVTAPQFLVEKGGFIIFIVSGSIIFDPGVLKAQGMYIADRTLSVANGTNEFKGEGLFAGWGGVTFNRDLGSNNDTEPAETFTYRPDFLLNAPPDLRFPEYTWNQKDPTKVNPTGVTFFDTP